MTKTADYVYSVDDIEPEFYDPNCHKTRLSILGPTDIINDFLLLCKNEDQYRWETLEILLKTARNRRCIQLRMDKE